MLPLMATAFAPSPLSKPIRISNPASYTTNLKAAVPDLDTIALVAGQENYGLAVVLVGEGLWSFGKAPSVDHALKTLVPAGVAAAVLANWCLRVVNSQTAIRSRYYIGGA